MIIVFSFTTFVAGLLLSQVMPGRDLYIFRAIAIAGIASAALSLRVCFAEEMRKLFYPTILITVGIFFVSFFTDNLWGMAAAIFLFALPRKIQK